MQLQRWALVAMLVMCASLVHAVDEILVQDVDNNEVLPESDVRRARVNDVPASTAVPTTLPTTGTTPETAAPTSTSQPTTTAPSTSRPTSAPTTGPPSSTTPNDEPPAPTTAPTRPPSTLSRFLSDIIQIPIAVLRSVGSLLSNTFSGHRSSSTGSTPVSPEA